MTGMEVAVVAVDVVELMVVGKEMVMPVVEMINRASVMGGRRKRKSAIRIIVIIVR